MTAEEIRQIVAEELDKRFPSMPKYLSTEEKAQQMGIKPETLRRMARSGKINCIKCDTGIKSRYRFYPWQIIRRDSWRLATRSETGERNQSNGRYMPCPISHRANHKEAEPRRRLFRDERSLTYRTKQYRCNKVTVASWMPWPVKRTHNYTQVLSQRVSG